MKYLFLTFILFSHLASAVGQRQDSLLWEAYQSHSPEKLDQFFNDWALETAPISPTELNNLNDTVRAVYQVFQEFYDPRKMERTGNEWVNDMYSKVKYLVIQNWVTVGLVDTLDKEALLLRKFKWISEKLHVSVDSVRKGFTSNRMMRRYSRFDWPEPDKTGTLYFQPQVSFRDLKTVMLTVKYDSILNKFLGSSCYPQRAGDVMFVPTTAEESASRQQFLENSIKIWYSQYGAYWELYSYPYVNSIIFDKTLKFALVNFTLVSDGGYAYYKKINNAWTLIESGRTWTK